MQKLSCRFATECLYTCYCLWLFNRMVFLLAFEFYSLFPARHLVWPYKHVACITPAFCCHMRWQHGLCIIEPHDNMRWFSSTPAVSRFVIWHAFSNKIVQSYQTDTCKKQHAHICKAYTCYASNASFSQVHTLPCMLSQPCSAKCYKQVLPCSSLLPQLPCCCYACHVKACYSSEWPYRWSGRSRWQAAAMPLPVTAFRALPSTSLNAERTPWHAPTCMPKATHAMPACLLFLSLSLSFAHNQLTLLFSHQACRDRDSLSLPAWAVALEALPSPMPTFLCFDWGFLCQWIMNGFCPEWIFNYQLWM